MKHQYLVDKDNRIRVTIVFDKLGRQESISNGVATSIFAYNPATLALDTETITYNLPGQPAFTRVIDRSRDNLGRDSGWQLKKGNTIENQAEYQYSATDRRLFKVLGLASSSHPSPQFTYGYTPNSHLLATITGPVHTVTNTYEPTRDVLASKENKAGTTLISKYDYTVNAIGQRTEANTSGTAFPATPSWSWGYDSLGQVTTADSSVNTSDRAYQYDAIGNRKKSANSLTLPGSDNYTSNELNQYSSLSLNSQPATLNDYDFDGNLTSGQLPTGSAGLLWDAENRLIAVNVIGQETIHYAYDAQSRRISRNVGTETTLYVYDAWNVIAEYSGTRLTKTYLWGTDLSGSLQGAGGVGGLLCESQISNSQISNFYPTYDGNGNFSEYLAADGSTAAHFEYDPFGNTIVNTDTNNLFAYRFSTKPLDQATGLYYYGYRYYDPVTGRWPSRDPIEEEGGINLYGFVGNDGMNKWDYLGRITQDCKITIFAGHKNAVNREMGGFGNKKKHNCDEFYGAGCHIGKANERGTGFVWPSQEAKDASINGTHSNPDFNNVADKADWTMGDLLGELIFDAEMAVYGKCDEPCCCKNIEIEVICDPGHSWEGSMKGAKKDPKVKAACAYRNTYSCKSGFKISEFRYQNGGPLYQH